MTWFQQFIRSKIAEEAKRTGNDRGAALNLAKRWGMDHSNIMRWESGERSPTIKTLSRIAAKEGRDFAELFAANAEPKTVPVKHARVGAAPMFTGESEKDLRIRELEAELLRLRSYVADIYAKAGLILDKPMN